MLWHITLIEYTASETGSTLFNRTERISADRRLTASFPTKRGKKNIFLLKARSLTQESSIIALFYPLNELLSLQFQEFVNEKSQSDRLFQFTVEFLIPLITDLLDNDYYRA